MEASVHAFALVGVILSVVYVRTRQRTAKPTLDRCLFAPFPAVLAAFLFPTHMCHAGDPVSQTAIPILAMVYAIVTIRNWWCILGVSVVVLTAGYLLSLHYLHLVHTGSYAGYGHGPGACWLWHTPLTGLFGVES